MLISILRNLIINAIKFSYRKSEIIFSAEIKEGKILSSIRDFGIGISESKIENLFTLGEKTSVPGTEGEISTGLGLILCKEFIQKNDGEIWVESKLGEGSSFYFSLPEAK